MSETENKKLSCSNCGNEINIDHIDYLKDRITRCYQEIAKLKEEIEGLEEEKTQEEDAQANGYCDSYCWD